MGVKKTFEEVRNYIKSQGDKLAQDHYDNDRTPLKIKCGKCKKVYLKTYNNYYHKNSRCPKCAEIQRRNTRRGSFKQTKKDIENKFPMLEVIGLVNKKEKFGYRTKIWIKCTCGYKYKDTRDNCLNRGRGCKKCSLDRKSERFRLSLPEAEKRCKEIGLELLTKNYKNVKDLVDVRCLKKKCKYSFCTTLDTIHRKMTSCGRCNGSAGEKYIINILEDLKKKNHVGWYQKDAKLSYHFKKDPICKYKRESMFDFLITLTCGYSFVVEFDGKQHFEHQKIYGGEDRHEEDKLRDVIKTLHCKNNKITLLRIHYSDVSHCRKYIKNIVKCIEGDGVDPDFLYFSNKSKYSDLLKRTLKYNKNK